LPKVIDLNSVDVKDSAGSFSGERLRDVEGVSLHAGKKTEKILLDNIIMDRGSNNPRQVFSRVPGFNIVDNDVAGMQYGVGARGLHPSKMANFNVRQNGYEISADALGYPENYYLPPTEAVESIQVIRGASGLQYGPQFGGYINYQFYQPEVTPHRSFRFRNQVGMYGYYNLFADINYARKKWGVYSFYQYKMAAGWRPDSEVRQHTFHIALRFAPSPKTDLTAEYTYCGNLVHQPGGLTDAQFQQDPSQSLRSRNWVGIGWHLFSLRLRYTPAPSSRIEVRTFGLAGARDAVGFWSPVNIADPGEKRELLSDTYRNIGAEARYIQYAKIFKRTQVFLAGARFYYGHTLRRQGLADSLDGPDFRLINPAGPEQSSYTFPGMNVSAFTEMIWQLTDGLRVVPGLRMEYIRTSADGYYNEVYKDFAGNIIYEEKNEVHRNNERLFLLGGLGISWRKKAFEVYGNFSRNYRSVTFSDIQIINPNYRVDPGLKDEKGYTADLGFRWQPAKNWYLDVGGFYLYYADRIGTILKTDTTTFTVYRYRTNLSESHSWGVDAVMETNVLGWFPNLRTKYSLTWLVNMNCTFARYYDRQNLAIDGKNVEYTPPFLLRTSLSVKHPSWGLSFTGSYTASQYSDATNAKQSGNGNYGIIPASFLVDVSGYWRVKMMEFSLSVKNATNSSYFTQRSEGYSGPGIIPGAPLMVTGGLQVKL